MDMEFMDLYQRPYARPDVHPPYHGQMQQPHGQHYGQPQQYPFYNPHFMALYQQHQQRAAAAVMMGQAGPHGARQTEPKPRLAKDEVELLEREFSKNQKPNSSTKRELAEQMGVEVPRINNWFQNRRAKEKQLKKTAEFEAQQAQRRDSSEPKSSDEQDQRDGSEFYELQQPSVMSTATFEEHDSGNDESDGSESDRQQSAACEQLEHGTPGSTPPHQTMQSSPAPSNDDYVPANRRGSSPPISDAHVMSEFVPDVMLPDNFGQLQHQEDFQQANAYQGFEGLPAHCIALPPSATVETFADRDYYGVSSLTQFPSQLLTEGIASHNHLRQPSHLQPIDVHMKTEDVSPRAMLESSPVPPEVRFKSPPPPADIAGRRNMRRPAPLVATALRGVPNITGPKTGIDLPRRSETASPMRRISSASGLPGRVQKSFSSSMGPRSPFTIERNKEALFQSLQTTHSPILSSLNSTLTPVTPEGTSGQVLHESPMSASPQEEDRGFTFGSMGAASNNFPVYKAEMNVKTPPDTPGLANNFPEHFFPNAADQAWNFLPHDEPLPTPSLCSHDGSELQFSMASQIPGYIASQPVTPSFPPSIGPAYGGFFGNTEYNFPESYPADSSARSSPVAPAKSKQFQFAQNVTPQDFNER